MRTIICTDTRDHRTRIVCDAFEFSSRSKGAVLMYCLKDNWIRIDDVRAVEEVTGRGVGYNNGKYNQSSQSFTYTGGTLSR